VQLRNFWKQNDALSSAVYTLQSKLLSIPFHVEPRDFDVRSHVAQADLYTKNLYEMTGFGKGWFTGFAPALEDLFGQDNGLMVEVIGEGPKDGPIVGSALGIAPLDSARCTRTRNPLWPVYYTDLYGDRFKLHYTRVIMVEQMPSSIVEYNGVGYCAVSRAINAAQNLYDIATYKMEKLGSRPKRQILVGRKGLTVDNIFNAFRQADIQQDSEGLSRYSKVIAIAPDRATANSEVALDVIDLASAPDGFNEQESVTLGVYILAWAFGVDAREFWPASSSGATKADAMVQHMKARGKAIGNTIAALEKAFNRYYLPPHLKMVFDVQDDEEDAQRAAIADQESATIDRDVKAGVYDVRVARQKMLQAERITQTQYDDLELADGRLPGGEDVLTLFYSTDPMLSKLLDLSDAEYESVPIPSGQPYSSATSDKMGVKSQGNGQHIVFTLPSSQIHLHTPPNPPAQIIMREQEAIQPPNVLVVNQVNPTPVTNVITAQAAPAVVRIVNQVEPTPVTIQNDVYPPETPVTLDVHVEEPQRQVSRVQYNKDGRIISVTKEVMNG
jgi:hypothetical protein